jgi:hypothetical protein
MVGEEDNGSNLNGLDVEDDIEINAPKVEIGDNYTVVLDELENKDAFFVVFCNKPLHRCMEPFNDGWGNMWYEGYMILGGIWYKCMVGLNTQNHFYMLLKYAHLAITYFHLVIKSKFAMLSNVTRKSNPKFSMHAHIRENILNLIEDKQTYSPN